MKVIVLSIVCAAGLGACAAEPETLSETTQEIDYPNNVFYDKFNFLNDGVIGGQGAWTGNCVVAPYGLPDKNLDCTGQAGLQNGRQAMHAFATPRFRNYHLQFDVWTSGVVDGTHGKLFLEGPPGDGSNAIFQVAIGCDNIRATFKYYGSTQRTLLSFPCSNGPRYRVRCIWREGGNSFRCGAAVYPNDPVEANFVTIPTLYPIATFDRVRMLGGIGERQGTTTFDKVQILSD
jgi:hypothetical protein